MTTAANSWGCLGRSDNVGLDGCHACAKASGIAQLKWFTSELDTDFIVLRLFAYVASFSLAATKPL